MIGLILNLIAALLVLPVALLTLQVMAARFARPNTTPFPTQPTGQLAVLVPAHNESDVIRHNLMALQNAMPPNSRLLVVADNCTDHTAEIARQCGAEVLERSNDQLRGKGYALDAGIRHLTKQPPDVVIIIDADCRVALNALQRLRCS